MAQPISDRGRKAENLNYKSAYGGFFICGPEENRTPASAMRMLRNTTLLQAQR